MLDLQNRFAGTMLGLALGDALGAPAEGGVLERAAWKLVVLARGRELTWTDDTQMAIGLAESLLDCGGLNADHLALHWARSMDRWRGYGPGALRLLKRIAAGESWREVNRSVFPDGSFGNGAAMRAAPLGLFFHEDPENLRRAAQEAASITHAHPLGIEGGILIARATALALSEPFDSSVFLDTLSLGVTLPEYAHRLRLARQWLDTPPPLDEVRKGLGNSVRAAESTVTAIHLFLRHHDDFEGLLDSAVELGGDVDTIAAMAGGLVGARHGSAILPSSWLDRLEARSHIECLALSLHDSPHRPRKQSPPLAGSHRL